MTFAEDIKLGMGIPQAALESYYSPQLNQINMLQQQAKLEQLQGLDPVSQQNIAASQANIGQGQERLDLAAQQEQRISEAQQAEMQQQQSQLLGAISYAGMKIQDPEQREAFFRNSAQLMGVPMDIVTPENIEASASLYESSLNKSLSSDFRSFEQMTKGLSPEEKELAKRIKLRLEPGAVGSAAITIAGTGKTEEVATSEAAIAGATEGAKETAKLKSQLELKPEVEGAVKEAVSKAIAIGEIASKNRSNATALNIYETAMRGLNTSLGGTYTGPFVGLVPAMTSNQQIADGAVAAMAPVLKQIFRSAGEGSFSDSDQKLLLDMVPTRKDSPEARAAKINNINAIVTAKLGQQTDTPQTSQASENTTSGQGKRSSNFKEGQVAVNPATGQKKIYKSGQWVDL